MRLATIEVETPVGRERRLCVRDEDRAETDPGSLVDVTSGYTWLLERDGEPAAREHAAAVTPSDIREFLRRGDRALDAAREALDGVPAPGDTDGSAARADGDAGEHVRTEDGARVRFSPAEDGVRLLAPIPRPNTLRDFMAYEEHVRNTLGEPPAVWFDIPVCYKGNPDTVVGPGDTVAWPDYSDLWDYELELAAVIGKRGTDLDPDEADDYIAGYTVFNDFSARDTQGEEMDANLGPAKGKDFANALGPYLVTADAFDPTAATMTAEVDGETWSEGTPGEMHHSFADIVAHVSDSEPLHPGDVLGSGTVGEGCGLELGQFLEDGATVALEVEGIGRLENTVVATDEGDGG
ncbi:fumarylacetoacetate hydrolase family protein [Haloglomus litoreum]|uniref:fumarylacetoacetate hydrolase family protein n=1 Tax=Haloglomus litoreum TaxID=3034026 RepID=UPI0023E8154D|nr:fumarylacetoacetate hydrolase family protein [Haloglomus sp. DT116]